MQNTDSKKPDLDDSTNVSATHAAVDKATAASAREQYVRENGMEPISIWVIISLAIVALIGGGVLVNASFFDYGSDRKLGYTRKLPPGGKVEPTGTAFESYMKKGAAVYSNCAACHQANGAGAGAIPPLDGSEWVNDHTAKLAMIPLNGIEGEITVKGKKYSGNMAALGSGLNDYEYAALMTYLRNSWSNKDGKIFSIEMVQEARKLSDARANAGQLLTAEELTKDFSFDLKSPTIDNDSLVFLKSGLPAEAK